MHAACGTRLTGVIHRTPRQEEIATACERLAAVWGAAGGDALAPVREVSGALSAEAVHRWCERLVELATTGHQQLATLKQVCEVVLVSVSSWFGLVWSGHH